MFRFFLSSFSKKENMEKARLLLIEKLKEAIAAPDAEEVADRRYWYTWSILLIKS